MNDIDIEEGRRLNSKATPGPPDQPWEFRVDRDGCEDSEDDDCWNDWALSALGEEFFAGAVTENPTEDLALIVWLRNNAAAMFDAIETGRKRITELEAHILDIAAHTAPFGDIPDEPGWIGEYLLTAGALHRALGKIGHTAASCQAEAERDDAIETGRQWETIARQLAGHVRCTGCTTTNDASDCWCGSRGALAAFRDLADRTPTPTDGG